MIGYRVMTYRPTAGSSWVKKSLKYQWAGPVYSPQPEWKRPRPGVVYMSEATPGMVLSRTGFCNGPGCYAYTSFQGAFNSIAAVHGSTVPLGCHIQACEIWAVRSVGAVCYRGPGDPKWNAEGVEFLARVWAMVVDTIEDPLGKPVRIWFNPYEAARANAVAPPETRKAGWHD